MQHVSIQLVATPVFYLIPVLPMLSARLFIILQSVLVLQATWETHKLSANYHHVRIIVRLKFLFFKRLDLQRFGANFGIEIESWVIWEYVVNGFFVGVNYKLSRFDRLALSPCNSKFFVLIHPNTFQRLS